MQRGALQISVGMPPPLADAVAVALVAALFAAAVCGAKTATAAAASAIAAIVINLDQHIMMNSPIGKAGAPERINNGKHDTSSLIRKGATDSASLQSLQAICSQ
jgi:hypothetical protein